MKESENDTEKLINFLAAKLSVKSGSLCFCGNGKKFGECCGSPGAPNLVFTKDAVSKLIAYADSFHWNIPKIPMSLFKAFELSAMERLPCLFPSCEGKTVSCHLIPKNILRSTFGENCKDYGLTDGPVLYQFTVKKVKLAGCLRAFCPLHDNELFKQIDVFQVDSPSNEQQFYLALKATAFSLRETQRLLALDSQQLITRPSLDKANPRLKNVKELELDGTTLSLQYLRFGINHSLWQNALDILSSKAWDSPVYFHRAVSSSQPLFAAGVVNPSHDLKGMRINSEGALAITCALYAKDEKVHVFLACIDEESKRQYGKLFRQMSAATDEVYDDYQHLFDVFSHECDFATRVV